MLVALVQPTYDGMPTSVISSFKRYIILPLIINAGRCQLKLVGELTTEYLRRNSKTYYFHFFPVLEIDIFL